MEIADGARGCVEMKEPSWIWGPELGGEPNQYLEFRHEFTIDANAGAELCLAADTNFVAFLNEQYVGTGQFSDFPEAKTFSRMDVTDAIVTGQNRLRVLVHYCGVDHFSYIAGHPGLWFRLSCGNDEVVSGENTLWRVSSAYRQGDMPRLTPMMGFTFEYDARKGDGTWSPAEMVSDIATPEERSLPMPVLKQRTASRVVGQGVLSRPKKDGATVAELMQRDFLSCRRNFELFENVSKDAAEPGILPAVIASEQIDKADGAYIILDLKREECGFIDLEVESPAGTVVDIAVGEHLADGRVRASIGTYGFASRYITKDGRQRFTHYMNRYAGRYVELHITNLSGSFTLLYAGLLPFEYPLDMQGRFVSPDTRMNRIFEVSQRTMHLCMHEHYEDCPWREQALYANDSRIQALTGYYAFGEYDFPRVSFDLLGRTLGNDGYQEMCAPMRFKFTIPSFNMSWFLAISDHLRFSGDIEAARRQLPRMRAMMDAYQLEMANDLLPAPRGTRYWHFYDWSDGTLCGRDVHPDRGGLIKLRFDAPLNLFLVLALRAAAEVAEACGESGLAEGFCRQAEATSRAAHARFWNESVQAYETFSGGQAIEHFAELTQALALLCGVPDERRALKLRSRLSRPDNGWVPITLGQSLYKFEALLASPGPFAPDIFKGISTDWGYMLEQGATSFWETIKGSDDFGFAGSLCHGWSAVPAYLYQAYLLGIKPTAPGFATFEVAPVFGIIPSAEGQVPTPAGLIHVAWEKVGDEYVGQLSHPPNIAPVFVEQNTNCRWTIEIKKG